MHGCSVRRGICGILVVLSLTILNAGLLPAAELNPAWQQNPATHPDILWIARSNELVGISLHDNSLRARRDDLTPLLVSIDPADGNVWVLESDALHLLGRNAEQLLNTVPLPFDGKDVIEFGIAGINDTAWFLLPDALWHADASGNFTAPVTLPVTGLDLAVDPQTGDGCVLLQDRIRCHNRHLEISADIPLTISALAMARLDTGAYWLASNKQIARIDAIGNITLAPRLHGLKNIQHIVPDAASGAWLADNHDVTHVDADGTFTPAATLFQAGGNGNGNNGNGGGNGAGNGNGSSTGNGAANSSRIRSLLHDPVTNFVWGFSNKQTRSLDLAGNLSGVRDVPGGTSAIRMASLHRDLTPPSIELLAPEAETYTNNPRETIRASYFDIGSEVASDSLYLGLDAAFLPAECTLGDYAAHCTPLDDMADGYHTLSARIADLAGNWSEDASLNFTVDTIPPELFIESPEDGLLTNQPELLIDGKVSEWVELEINQEPVDLGTNFEFSTSRMLREGINDFLFSAEDRATNTSKENRSVTLDTTAPEISIESPANFSMTAESRMQILGHVSEEASITVNGRAVELSEGDFEFELLEDLQEGSNLFSFQAIDQAGNSSSKLLSIVRNSTPPEPLDIAMIQVDYSQAGSAIYFGAPGSLAVGSSIIIEPILDEDGREVLTRPIRIYGEEDGSFSFTLPDDFDFRLIVEDALGRRSQPITLADLADSPKQGKLVGALRGELSVDPNGTANYRVPITVPAGAGGMQPDLAFLYSSAAPNGQLGMGWSLSGLSAISRCGHTLAHEGKIRQVMYDAGDRLCLDGQRLLPQGGWSGSYLSPGRRFITEMASFQRIESFGGNKDEGPDGFKVEDKAGLTRYYGAYGAGPDARIETDGKNTAMTWMVSRIEDKLGNHIDFSYGYERGEYWPSEINWFNATDTKVGSVKFAYQGRPDKSLGALTDRTRRPMTRRMHRVTTYSRGNSGSMQQVLVYKINYEQSLYSNRTRIKDIEQCGFKDGAEVCLPATQFVWRDRPKPASYHRIWDDRRLDAAFYGRVSEKTSAQFVDLNNDGLLDAVWWADNDNEVIESSTAQEGDQEYIFGYLWFHIAGTDFYKRLPINSLGSKAGKNYSLFDANHDGYLDVVTVSLTPDRYGIYRWLPDQNTFETTPWKEFGGLFDADSGGFRPIPADIDGDGIQELIYKRGTTHGNTHAITIRWFDGSNRVENTNWGIRRDQFIRMIEFNGDGLPDMLIDTGDCSSYPNTEAVPIDPDDDTGGGGSGGGSGSGSTPTWHGCEATSGILVNQGDGTFTNSWHLRYTPPPSPPPVCLPEEAANCDDDPWSDGYESESTDPYYFPCMQDDVSLCYGFGTNFRADHPLLTDFNGDGLTDIVTYDRSNTTWRLWLNSGGFYAVKAAWKGTHISEGEVATSTMADINQDGIPDLIFGDESNFYLKLMTPHGFSSEPPEFIETKKNSRFMDIDADGDIDMMFKYDDWQVRRNIGTRVDLLAGVKLGTNEELEIAYQPLASLVQTDGKRPYLGHLSSQDSEKPLSQQRNAVPAMDVVSAIAVDTGTERRIATYYTYRGLKFDADRGFLGFREVRAHNETSGITTVNLHRQSWPFTGQVEESYQYIPARTQQNIRSTSDIRRDMRWGCLEERLDCDFEETGRPRESIMAPPRERLDAEAIGHKITHTINTLAKRTSAQGAVQVYVQASETTTRDYHSGNVIKRESTDFQYDGYGNATHITHTVSDGNGSNTHTTTTRNIFENNTASWILARLKRSEVTQTWKNDTKISVSEFEYSPSHGQLTSEALTSGGQSEQLATTYEHDNFGNVTRKTVTGWDGNAQASRSTTTRYDATGRFPESLTNTLGHTETYVWDQRLGVKRKVTGPNGLPTKYEHDAFGRVTSVEAPREDVVETVTRNWCAANSEQSCVDDQSIWLVSKSLSTGQNVITEYDRLGREVKVRTETYPAGWVSVEKRYDLRGRMIAESSPHKTDAPLCWTLYEYDNMNRPIGVYSPANANQCGLINGTPQQEGINQLIDAVRNTYSSTRSVYAGNTIYQQDAEGRNVARTTSASGMLLSVSERDPGALSQDSLPGVLVLDGVNMITRYSYDARGNTRQVLDPAGNTVSMSYDSRDRKIAMSDPDMGNWSYHYNAFGELIGQADAKGNSISMRYDALGRMIRREEAEGITTWVYDTASGKGLGKLARVIQTSASGSINYAEAYAYSEFGEAESSARVLEGRVYRTHTAFDSFGRIRRLIYPGTGIETTANPDTVNSDSTAPGETFAVNYGYDSRTGQLLNVRSGDDKTTYWQRESTDGAGRTNAIQTGSGLRIETVQDFATGAVLNQRVNGSTDFSAQLDMRYQWDRVGNLQHRSDTLFNALDPLNENQVLTETYSYDALYRLDRVNMFWRRGFQDFASGEVMNHRYDAVGNIKNMGNGVSGYQYGSGSNNRTRPHAVTAVTVHGTNKTYQYDANGNLMTAAWAGSTRNVTWTSFNKPSRIEKGASFSVFAYGADRARYKHVSHGPDPVDNTKSLTTTTWHVGGLYEQINHGSRTTHRFNIRAGNNVIAVKEIETAKADTNGTLLKHATRYFYRDHLGSIAMITDDKGKLIERATYSPWGQRKDLTNLVSYSDVGAGKGFANYKLFHRGYTGHEQLEHLGLVHMNGRIYDPEIGRFLSADPFVQFPESTQGFNRYAYVGNNPLSASDPSGHFLTLIVAVVAYQAGWTAVTTAIATFVAGYLESGGDVRYAAIAAVAAYATVSIGTHYQGLAAASEAGKLTTTQLIQKAFLHGAVQGTARRLNGGKFMDGFRSAFASSMASPYLSDNPVISTMQVATIGGTVEKMGGGKFANGAKTAAFVHILNHLSHAAAEEMKKPNLPENPVGPGGEFASADMAALDAIAHAQQQPDSGEREYGGFIKEYTNTDGETRYTYDVYRASDADAKWSRLSLPDTPEDAVGWYHRHPTNNFGFSTPDRNAVLHRPVPAYLGQPNGGVYFLDTGVHPSVFRHIAGPSYPTGMNSPRWWETLRP